MASLQAGAADIPAVNFASPTTSHTFTGPSDIFVCTGACTITVPVPSAGVQYCVMNDDNIATTITLSALELIRPFMRTPGAYGLTEQAR